MRIPYLDNNWKKCHIVCAIHYFINNQQQKSEFRLNDEIRIFIVDYYFASLTTSRAIITSSFVGITITLTGE